MNDEQRWLSVGEHDVPGSDEWLTSTEREVMGGLRFTKRRDEWLVARWTAKQALAEVLRLERTPASLARLELSRNGNGAPEPRLGGTSAGVAISMTDRAGWAVCLVGPDGTRVGVDLELVEPRSELFVRDWFTAPEQALVAAAPDTDGRDCVANLIWSAKESALKVLQTGLRRSTHSVEVHLDGAPGVGGPGGWQPLVVAAQEGDRYPGWWQRFGSFVLTVAAETELGPPVSLADPPGLVSAEPVHSWIERPLA